MIYETCILSFACIVTQNFSKPKEIPSLSSGDASSYKTDFSDPKQLFQKSGTLVGLSK